MKNNGQENNGADKRVILLCLTLAAMIFAIDSSIPLGVAGGVPYILIVLVSLWSPREKMPLYMAIIGSILTIIGFYCSPPGGELWKVLFNRILALFAIWTTAILSLQRKKILDDREKALLKVKVLSGFLPICASCKKIRDDKGYWKQIELYIHEHSEAEFSHGVCPDCAKELYAELELDSVDNTGK